MSIIVIFCFLTIILESQQNQKFKVMPLFLQDDTCHNNLKYMQTDDLVIGQSNYSKILEENKNILVIATHRGCKSCCHHEQVFKELKSINEVDFKIARLEIAENFQFVAKYEIKRFPFLLIFLKYGKTFIPYNNIIDFNQIEDFILRTINREEKQVEVFKNLQNLEKKFQTNNSILNPVQIVGIFYDKKEFEEEIKQFYSLAEKTLSRNYRIEFSILSNKNSIKQAKQKYKDLWFSDYSLSSILIKKGNQYKFIDLTDVVLNQIKFEEQINKLSLCQIDEFLMSNYAYYKLGSLPILVIVVDSIRNTQITLQYLKFFEENIASIFSDQIHITWIEGALNEDKIKLLGLEQRKFDEPSLAFFRIESDLKVVYPSNLGISNIQKITEFIQDYLNKPIHLVAQKYKSNSTLDKKSLLEENIIYWKQQKLNLINNTNELNFTKYVIHKKYILVYQIPLMSNYSLLNLYAESLQFIKQRIRLFNQDYLIKFCIQVDQSIEKILINLHQKFKKSLINVPFNETNKILEELQIQTENTIRFPKEPGIIGENLFEYYAQQYKQFIVNKK